MSGEGSDGPAREGEERTRFSYGNGGVPVYVGVVWVLFIVAYVSVMSAVALPDFLAWMRS